MQLQAADIAVLGVYFAVIVGIGWWASRQVKSTTDYIMPRRFGKLMMLFFSFGTGTQASDAVNVSSKTYQSGLSGVWMQWNWLFCSPFYWLIAAFMRRFRATTTADVFEARYNRSVSILYSFVGLAFLIVTIGTSLKAAAAIVETGAGLPEVYALVILTILILLYGMAGGLSAAIITDLIQGVLTIAFSIVLLPCLFSGIGGLDGLKSTFDDPATLSPAVVQLEQISALSESGADAITITDPASGEAVELTIAHPGNADAMTTAIENNEMMKFVGGKTDVTIFFIVMITIASLTGIIAYPHTMANCGAGRTEMDGRVGFMCGMLLKRICTIPWCLIGLAAFVFYATVPGHELEFAKLCDKPDGVFGMAANEFLPKILPGLLGLFLAAAVAAAQSSCDAFMIAASGLFTENIYRPMAPNRSRRHYVWAARLSSLIVVLLALLFAYWVKGVIPALKIFWDVGSMMGIAFWLGIFWRRTTSAGAWAGTVVAVALFWITRMDGTAVFLAKLPFAEALSIVREEDGVFAIYTPWRILSYLSAGTLTAIIVSLFTPMTSKEKLDNFYALVRTPVTPGEEVVGVCQLPEGSTPSRRKMFPNTNIEIHVPSKTSLIGFVLGWVCVAGLIYSFFEIMK